MLLLIQFPQAQQSTFRIHDMTALLMIFACFLHPMFCIPYIIRTIINYVHSLYITFSAVLQDAKRTAAQIVRQPLFVFYDRTRLDYLPASFL